MESEKPHNNQFKPEIGRGCAFCNCGSEVEARPCDGCFKLHETAWLDEYPVNIPTDIVEVRFKNTRRSFYQNVNNLPLKRGDIVAVEASPGHDIGIVSLTGDLVARQMRRTGFNPYNGEFKKIYRKAKPFDIERWQEAIALEHETMIASRQIAAEMGLNMKIGDVEYQGDKIKAIFYYIADERVDFRELIKVFAERFHIRIEMKQIGARQEAGRIGGLGACGRELCCASWMSSFSSVTTGAARVQDISLNPQKLAGQCSKLKCCMMYEYDTYVDARKEFPRLREPLQTIDGEWFLVKSDVLAGTMTFSSSKEAMVNTTTLPVARVKEILALNRQGKKAEQLQYAEALHTEVEEPTYRSEEDSITRFDQAKRRKRGGRNRNRNGEKGAAAGHAPNESRQGRAGNDSTAKNDTAAKGDSAAKKEETARPAREGNRNERRTRRNNERTNSGEGQNERGEGRRQEEARPGRERRQNTPAEAREKGPRGGENPAGSGDTPRERSENGSEGRNRRRNRRRGNNGSNGSNGSNGEPGEKKGGNNNPAPQND
ncbi:regulatory iron-sulfur-containing complex subunit RicT [uncultured Alistipes sp.]|uniref:regulatory iron-sulfur-containing complex subunit RicT n=1 Tax=uncultured Alistipes sp. TaxID=538949 RepID=UPI00260BC2A0|nr:regulatory iron-sulfur-containing complex subunit RicT [uncultured Alistipes sp.]